MASSEILSQTLHSITSIKLDQLDKQKSGYETGKRALLEDAAYETDNRKRAKLLVEGARNLPTMISLAQSQTLSISNMTRFIQQSEYDPSISDEFLADYESAIRNELDVQSAKYRFAELYGRLVNEWISAGKSNDSESDSESGFIPVGRDEMHQQRATWEEYVFRARETDPAAITSYLEDLFHHSSKDVHRAFKNLVTSIKWFQEAWDGRKHFTEETVTSSIRGLLRTDMLTDQKRSTLNDFLGKKIVLKEIADVLNMRMQTRSTWCWDTDSYIDQRRQLNGRYRFYPDEDLLQSIFLQYIGRSWAVEIRRLLHEFIAEKGVWKPATEPMKKEDIRRRRYFLKTSGSLEGSRTLESTLAKKFIDEVLLDQLPRTMEEERGGYDQDDGDSPRDTRKSHTNVVQGLLHLLQTQIIMNKRLGKDTTVIRSDFKWFGPSVPHSSIFAVLEFFGIEPGWMDFFKRVLECPVRFKQDPHSAPAQIRRRGTPLGTPLADFFSESMLFCLDFAVNQKADGERLYRLHDDMWLWGGAETCAQAWRTISQFTDLMGLAINETKTGSVRISRKGTAPGIPSGLPKGDVTWGFLKLDPETGRFLLDQSKVDEHIEELRVQLRACKSVFDWIQAWNIYGARFFTTNFGKVANCYSRAHVDNMLATFHRIQQKLFGKGGVGDHLKELISDRFGVRDVPDGYLYFPVSLGGLGLKNPFISLFAVRDHVTEDPDEIMDAFFEEEEAEYRALKTKFDMPDDEHLNTWDRPPIEPEDPDLKTEPFFSFEEFVKYRERTSAKLLRALEKLRHEPEVFPPGREDNIVMKSGPGMCEEVRDTYEQWVCQLYAKDMIVRFGGLSIVEKGLLPMGLMDMLRQRRFKWQD